MTEFQESAIQAAVDALEASIKVMAPTRREPPPDCLVCSFCGKTQREVRKLIAGPTVYICDECVGLCVDIIAEDDPWHRLGIAASIEVLADEIDRVAHDVRKLRREAGL